jgi:hypothetical protein
METEDKKSPYDILSDIYVEETGQLSTKGKEKLDDILDLEDKSPKVEWRQIVDKVLYPFYKVDSFIFKDPPKMGNAFNKRSKWF